MTSSFAPVAGPARGALLIGALALLSAACSSGGSAAPPATVTVTHSPASTPATAPATSAPATTGAPAPAECATASLRITVSAGNGAAGTIYYNIDFTNASGSACVLQGYPGVSLVSAPTAAGSQIGADAKRTATTAVRPVTVSPGQTAHAQLGIATAGNFPASSCNPVTAHYLKVFPPDQTAAVFRPFTTPTCASTSQPTMHIAAITGGS